MIFSIVIPVMTNSKTVGAVSGSDWKAGRIIDDAIFFDSSTMTPAQIQQFLDAKVPICDRNRPSSNPTYQPPWTCLKEYQENITTHENNIGRFNANGSPYQVVGGKSAAVIIWEVAQQYGINPQVLIVMLQKEQSLITDNWPWAVQYQKAMGYACPDTAPCDEQYYGFYNQVSSAAWQLKRYVDLPNNYNFKAGVTRYIQYNPNTSCGGTNVFLENPATAALYNYTPYQPNPGALSNLNGSSDCGAYGNRNFWKYFNDWFGTTYIHFESFATPRWMQLNKNTYKINVNSLSQVDSQLVSGQQIKFASKVYLNGYWCYRTEYDTNNFNPKCIPASDVSEIVINYQPLNDPEKLKAISQSTNKVSFRTDAVTSQNLSKDTQVSFDSTVTIGPYTYYVTSHDKQKGFEYGVLLTRLRDTSAYEAITPQWYKITSPTFKVIPLTTSTVDSQLPTETQLLMTSRVNISGTWYYRTNNDTFYNFDKAIAETSISPIVYEPFANPRWMEIAKDTSKKIITTSVNTDGSIRKNTQIKFASKILIGGIVYYRTEYDTVNNNDKAIPANDIKESSFEMMLTPRTLKTSKDLYKIDAFTQQKFSPLLPANTSIQFSSKILINNEIYLRSTYDNDRGYTLVIPYSLLRDI